MAEKSKTAATKTGKKSKAKKKVEKVPYHSRPSGMSMEKWQIALRRQFVENNDFQIEKTSPETVFADYLVSNPSAKSAYKVALRSADYSANFCECYDYKVNRLGTCKHIEAVFRHVAKKRLKKHLKTPETRAYSSVYLDYRKGRQVCIRIGAEQQEDIADLALDYFDDHAVLTPEGYLRFEIFLQKARNLSPDFRCYDDALAFILEQREHLKNVKKVNELSPVKRNAFLDGLTLQEMFPYQKEGVLFAFQHGRVIIGDEMGLGKTIQAIAAAELLRRERGIHRALILAPTSLKYQWKTEIEKFTGHTALVVEGVATVRARTHRDDETFYKIASYHSALYDWESMDAGEYDLLILDEAQRIKNWRTKIAQSVRKIRARHVIVLTGTPIENNLEELYGLAQFVDPFALGPRHEFFPRYQTTDDNGRVIGYENLGEIRQLLTECLIRRTKKEVLKQLPPRSDKNLVVPMTKQQSEMHREFADQVARLVLKWQRMKFLDEQDRQKLLKNLNMMRMVCDSTYIIDQQTNYQTKIDELRNILTEILEIEGEKVVIFSQWARMTHLVSKELEAMGVGYRYLHGDVPGKDRGALYTDFNALPEVRVFLSTDAGGVGLNLQSAAWLINLDIPWNPGILEQRIGRIYRLGQEKPVNIINLVAQSTIEHNLLGVLHFKKSMAAGVLDDGEDSIFLGDSKFKKFMESVEVITRDTAGPSEAIAIEELEPVARPDESPEDALPDASAATPTRALADDSDEAPAVQKPSHMEPKRAEQDAGNGNANTPRGSVPTSPQALIQNGVSFFSDLAQTLSNPKRTEELVASLVEKDAQTGQTYIKIPVENQAVVQNAMQLLGALLGNLGSR